MDLLALMEEDTPADTLVKILGTDLNDKDEVISDFVTYFARWGADDDVGILIEALRSVFPMHFHWMIRQIRNGVASELRWAEAKKFPEGRIKHLKSALELVSSIK